MKRLTPMMLAAIVAAIALCPSTVVHGVGGSCLPRALTTQEKQAGERVAATLRPLLPPAPAGWRVDGADATDIASGSCLQGGKSVPQPVSVQVRRSFIREGSPLPPPPRIRPRRDRLRSPTLSSRRVCRRSSSRSRN
jgi:hypothetical protein